MAQRQLVEIGMFTKDVQYLEAKHNHMADFLSRRTPEALIGEAYKSEKSNDSSISAAKGELVDFSKIKKVAATEEVKIDTISIAELAKMQESCPEIENCKKEQTKTMFQSTFCQSISNVIK